MFGMDSKLVEGVVKFFKDDKGYGFIQTTSRDYFVHFRDIISEGHRTLKEGQRVKFVPETSPKGHVAKNVELV